ncbi:MAG: phosphomannomutase [Paracoccaceae bacterium]
MTRLTCFTAYDVRGRVGENLDEGIAYRIGRGFARVLAARRVVIGRDCRATSMALSEAVIRALLDEGAEVLDLGLAGTEEMYHATTEFGADGGITVTASHNPIDYNGMKMVGRGAAPLDGGQLGDIRGLAEANKFGPGRTGGSRTDISVRARVAYVATVLSFVDVGALNPLTIVVNAGNGAAGPTFDAIAAALALRGAPLRFVRMHHAPDGSFPHGIPNPLLPENRPLTAAAVVAAGADFGVAWDGDFDRCFLFDETGAFVDGEYVVGLLAQAFLAREPGARIVHDPRVIWNTQDVVAAAGGVAVQVRTGHAFIKQAMRDMAAVYGGEMSAHHYFRDFTYCDSGMIPWLMIAELLCRQGVPLSEVLADRRAAFPSSGEMNFTLVNPAEAIARVRQHFAPLAVSVDEMDGLGLSFAGWRFNLRASNTEPVVRMNVESRGGAELMAGRVAAIRKVLLGV